MRLYLSIALLSGLLHGTVLCADGVDRLVIDDDSAVFLEPYQLEAAVRMQRSLGLKASRDRYAVAEVVTSRTEVQPSDSSFSLNCESDGATNVTRWTLEYRESNDSSPAQPQIWKLEIPSALAAKIHESWVKMIHGAGPGEPGKSWARVPQWFRCHTDKAGFRTAVMPGFRAGDGRLQALDLAVAFGSRWVKSSGKDKEMEERFRAEIEKLVSSDTPPLKN